MHVEVKCKHYKNDNDHDHFVTYVDVCEGSPSGLIKANLDTESYNCQHCKEENILTPVDESNNVDLILQAGEDDIEGANYHSMTSLPSDLYNAIKEFIPKKHRVEVAKQIVKECTRNM